MLDVATECIALFQQEQEEAENDISESFQHLREMEIQLNETMKYSEYAIIDLVDLINMQLNSLRRAQE
mgnify:CR=1 FL=1